MVDIDYDFKANITTVLSFILLPVLSSFGMDAMTGSAMVGVVAYVGVLLFMYLNERYLSKIFTKPGYGVVKNSDVCSCPVNEEDAVNPEYTSEVETVNPEYTSVQESEVEDEGA